MFNKAMYTSSGNISKYTQDLIRQKSQNSQQVETAIKSCISQNGGTNSFSNCLGYDDAEMSGDLFYSIQHVDIYVSGKKINNDTWHITITMEDIYDFEKREWNSFANYINNLGYYMQETDMLRSYYWSISYDMIYKEWVIGMRNKKDRKLILIMVVVSLCIIAGFIWHIYRKYYDLIDCIYNNSNYEIELLPSTRRKKNL